MIVGGEEIVTATDVTVRWPDVTAQRLRDWARRGLLRPLTRGELAELMGLPPPPHADDPARMWHPVSRRYESVYRWREVTRVEAATGTSRHGRKRRPTV